MDENFLRIKNVYKFMINSLTLNVRMLKIDDNQTEKLYNEIFNVLTNTLEPEYAEIFLNVLISMSEDGQRVLKEIEIKETMEQIYNGMRNN